MRVDGVGSTRPDAAGAVVVVAYQGRRHLSTALRSCRRHAAGVPVYVVDNGSTDGGPAVVAAEFPDVHLLMQSRNLGFAGGNNVGIRAAVADGAQWVLLLNQDAELTDGAVERLAAFLDAHPEAAAVQPAIMRGDGLVNSLGNPLHYLGFSVAGGNGLTESEAEADPSLPWLRDPRWRTGGVQIPLCSGAAAMLRVAALDEVGTFEEELFLYHEDLELSLRLRRAGWTLWLLGCARVIHHYEFSRTRGKWYYLERNRHWVLLAHLRAPTLALIAVPLVGAEIAVWLLAWRGGWTREKLRSYRYWLEPGRARYLRRRRAELRTPRGSSDRELLRVASSRFEVAETHSAFNERVVNPASELAWRVLYPCLRW